MVIIIFIGNVHNVVQFLVGLVDQRGIEQKQSLQNVVVRVVDTFEQNRLLKFNCVLVEHFQKLNEIQVF